MRIVLVTLVSSLLVGTALAHGPTPQRVSESIDIKADPKAVWQVARDFGNVAKWDDVLKASEGSDKSRKLTFKNGETIEESVDEFDDGKMTYSYRMSDPNAKAVPASSYSATLTVSAGSGGGSHVEWIGRVYRADTGNEPPDDMNDEAAKGALGALFKVGLQGLKARTEGKS